MEKRGKRVREESMARKWEDLPTDCLANILQRLEVEELMLRVPLVCKSWHNATLSPGCWQVLNMATLVLVDVEWDEAFDGGIPMPMPLPQLFSFLLRRSCGSTTKVIFPDYFLPMKDVAFLLERCPMIEILALPHVEDGEEDHIVPVVTRLKNLRYLYLRHKPSFFVTLVREISHHCKNLVGLQVAGWFRDDDVAPIVELLPKLKYLCLSGSFVAKDHLLRILKGCRELEEFLVDQCAGFAVDQELMDAASHVRFFRYDPPVPKDEYLHDMCGTGYGSPVSDYYDWQHWESLKYVKCGDQGEVQFRCFASYPSSDDDFYCQSDGELYEYCSDGYM